MESTEWLVQLRKGTIELCILALLADREWYGYDLVQALNAPGPVIVAEGTIYPLMRRLRDQGLVSSAWQESPAGPPRKYYRLTPSGRAHLKRISVQWHQFSAFVNRLLGGNFDEPEPAESEVGGRVSRPSRTKPLRLVSLRPG